MKDNDISDLIKDLGEKPKILIIRSAPIYVARNLLEELKNRIPKAKIDFLVQHGIIYELTTDPFINEIILYRGRRFNIFKTDIMLWLKLLRRKYDLVIALYNRPHFKDYFHVDLFVQLIGAKKKMGYNVDGNWLRSNNKARLFAQKVKYLLKPSPISELSISSSSLDPEHAMLQMQRMADASRDLLDHYHHTNSGPSLLFLSLRAGWQIHTAWETVIATGLLLRGVRPEFLSCGGGLPMCGIGNINVDGYPAPENCQRCTRTATGYFDYFGFRHMKRTDFVSSDEFQPLWDEIDSLNCQQVDNFSYQGLKLGQIIKPTMAWFLGRDSLPPGDLSLQIQRSFLKSAVVMAETLERIITIKQYDGLFMVNGVFFAEAIAIQLAERYEIPYICYEYSFRNYHLLLSPNDSIKDMRLDKWWLQYKDIALSTAENAALDSYLESRKGPGDTRLELWPTIKSDRKSIIAKLRLDLERPIAVLFSNKPGDTNFYGRQAIFQDMLDWISETIKFVSTIPESQLVIRVHPAETKGSWRSNQPIEPALRDLFPVLPSNIIIVPSESPISSYVLMEVATVGLSYISTTGLEMTLIGKPVIIGANAPYSQKGFTYDPGTKEEYFQLLSLGLQGKLQVDQKNIELARRFAYLYFFRLYTPFNLITMPARGQISVNFNSLEQLMPGRSAGLDKVCQVILETTRK